MKFNKSTLIIILKCISYAISSFLGVLGSQTLTF